MNTLVIIRHAETQHGGSYGKDFYRKLTAEGRRDAELLSSFLKRTLNKRIDHMEVSPASRTRSTASYFIKELLVDEKVVMYNDDIYEAAFIDLMEIVNAWNEQINTAILIGHNPSVHSLANHLMDYRPLISFPPGSIVVLNSEKPWREWDSCTGKSMLFTTPEKLKEKR